MVHGLFAGGSNRAHEFCRRAIFRSGVALPAREGHNRKLAWIPAFAGMTLEPHEEFMPHVKFVHSWG